MVATKVSKGAAIFSRKALFQLDGNCGSRKKPLKHPDVYGRFCNLRVTVFRHAQMN